MTHKRIHTDPGPLDLNVMYVNSLLKKMPDLEPQCKEEIDKFRSALAERVARLTINIGAEDKRQPLCGGKLNRLSRELLYAIHKSEQQRDTL